MSYISKFALNTIDGSADFSNSEKKHECAVLVQMTAGAPNTTTWKKGKKVMDCTASEISAGTVIATFDETGKYPVTDRHAAIYESHDKTGINVIDQWNNEGKAKRRKIRLKDNKSRDVNNASSYFIVE
jgi:hypothetical protein